MNRAKPRVTTVLLKRRALALKRHLQGAVDGDGGDVHQARVASRRLREAVPVLSTGLKGSKAGKAQRKIRKLTRALGTVRELDVTVKVLDELAARETLPRLALEEVRAHVVEHRQKGRSEMLKRLEQVNTGKLDRRLESFATALQDAESEGWRKTLASRLAKRSKALALAVSDAGQMYSAERLHAVRIAVKKLRYSLEIAAETGARSAAPLVRLLKRAQDALGRLHDLQVLQGHIAAVQATPPSRGLPDGGLDILSRVIEDECRHLHGRYVAAAPALAEVVDSTRRNVIPTIAHPSRARRPGLKMALSDRARRRAKGEPAAAGGRG